MKFIRSQSGLIKWVIATLIISWLITASAAFELTQLQWDTGTSGTLKRDGVISYMDYSVKVTAFTGPVESDRYKNMPVDPVEAFVGLNISKNGKLINETMLGRGESYITPDGEFKVTAVDLPASSSPEWLFESYDPWVNLELSPRGKPGFAQSVNTENEYISAPNTEIVVNVIVNNPGTADMLNVDLEVGTNLPILRGNLNFHYDRIIKGEQVSETMTFSSPIITELTKYDIYANVSGFDVKDISYNNSLLKTIQIVPPPQQIPIIRKSSNPKMYLKDYDLVSLSFKNTLNYELKNVSISDTLPEGFKQISNNSLNWLVDVPANGEWTWRYILKPTEANKDGIIFPAAKAEFKLKKEYYMVQSNTPETIVYGPRIELTKQTDISEITPGDTVTVTIVAVNKGSTPSKVNITDTVPGDVTLLSGTTKREEYLEANKEVTFSYTIRSDSESPFKLPAAEANYFELGDRGAKIGTKSQEPLISIKLPPTPEPMPEPTPEPSPTIEPEVEGLLTPVVNETPVEEVPVDVTEKPKRTDFVEPESGKPSIDGKVILNVILGCDKIAGNDLQNTKISGVCTLVNNAQ
ncbi:MAG: hypothetical protein O8C61_01540 [Candidatus Methanoperedens sp.]|nr:hypothetical protein [Candidatus Methanoperedens sp.]